MGNPCTSVLQNAFHLRMGTARMIWGKETDEKGNEERGEYGKKSRRPITT